MRSSILFYLLILFMSNSVFAQKGIGGEAYADSDTKIKLYSEIDSDLRNLINKIESKRKLITPTEPAIISLVDVSDYLDRMLAQHLIEETEKLNKNHNTCLVATKISQVFAPEEVKNINDLINKMDKYQSSLKQSTVMVPANDEEKNVMDWLHKLSVIEEKLSTWKK